MKEKASKDSSRRISAAILLMSCWLQNQRQFLANDPLKKVTFPESSAIRMSCLSFSISASISEQINLYKMPEAKEISITAQRQGVQLTEMSRMLLNSVSGDNTHSRDETVELFKQTTQSLVQRVSVPRLISSTSLPGRNGGTSFVSRIPYCATSLNTSYSTSISLRGENGCNPLRKADNVTSQQLSRVQCSEKQLVNAKTSEGTNKTCASAIAPPEGQRNADKHQVRLTAPGTQSSIDSLTAFMATENQTQISLCEKFYRRRLRL